MLINNGFTDILILLICDTTRYSEYFIIWWTAFNPLTFQGNFIREDLENLRNTLGQQLLKGRGVYTNNGYLKWELSSNKAKGQISKRVSQENKAQMNIS